MNTKPKDPEGELLKLGWDTESTSSTRMMARRGGKQTQWHDTWHAVLQEVLAMPSNNQAQRPERKDATI